jgi:hypothetical protein
LVTKPLFQDLPPFGEAVQLSTALKTTGMDAKEMPLPQATSLTQSDLLELELLTPSQPSTEELRSELNSPEEIGYGQQFGCSQPTKNSENGQHLEKSISWNQEEMTPAIQVVELILSDQLSIGDLTGTATNTQRPTKNTNIQHHSLKSSTPMDSTGIRTNSTHILMTKTLKFLKLISQRKVSSIEENIQQIWTTHGLVKTTLHHSTESSISS